MCAAHSAIGASSAKRWMNCAGSVALCADLPNEESEFAKEGSAAHAWAEYCLENGVVDCSDYVGAECPSPETAEWTKRGFPLTQEMADAVNVYLEHVWSVLQPEDELHVERRVVLEHIAPGMFGTSDCGILKPKGVLHVIDYKHGAGVAVDVENNEQAKYYAVGMLHMFREHNVHTVVTTIVQPRAPGEPVKSCEYDALDLMEWAYLELQPAAQATRQPGAPCNPGPWCAKTFCPARLGKCTAFRDKARAVALDGMQVIAPVTVDAMPISDLAERIRELPMLKAFIASVEDRIASEAKAGKAPPPGFKWVAGRGVRVWSDSETAVAFTVKERLNVDITERVTLSPTQAEKAIGKKQFAETCADLVTKKYARPSLVHESDKRPAISLDELRNASALLGMEALE